MTLYSLLHAVHCALIDYVSVQRIQLRSSSKFYLSLVGEAMIKDLFPGKLLLEFLLVHLQWAERRWNVSLSWDMRRKPPIQYDPERQDAVTWKMRMAFACLRRLRAERKLLSPEVG